jgi:glycosyl hydrolase family 2
MTGFERLGGAGWALVLVLVACSRKDDARALPTDAGADGTQAIPAEAETETERIYLSGQGVEDAVEWDFQIDTGARAGSWSRLPVPSHWELFGFGNIDERASTSGEQGTYRRSFSLPVRWATQRVWLVFEGAMTDTSVRVNGQSAGPTHQGGFYRFEYDVSELVTPGDNQLEVVVSERSENASVNAVERGPEHWSLGGIYRPVYVEVYPEQFIERIAADARPNGDLAVDVYVPNLKEPAQVVARLFDSAVRSMGPALSADIAPGASVVRVSGHFEEIDPWTPEGPDRYLLEVELRTGGETRHVLRERIGFRSVELRANDGVYLNGRKTRLRGLARRGVWPDTGFALSAARSTIDVRAMKGMNANAVRNAHQASDATFLEQADIFGLYVLEELAGAAGASYDLEVGKRLVKELVTASVNHPSVLLWSNGSAGAFTPELDSEFAVWDPSRRPVIHPAAADAAIDTLEYPSYAALTNALANTLTLPTALLRALHDGGGGAGLDDYWAAIVDSPRGAGAFVWGLADQLVQPPGAAAAPGALLDGVLDAYRQPEGSFYTLREIWSPVQIALRTLPADFSGTLPVQSRFEFFDLGLVTFRWRLANFHFGPGTGYTIAAEGAARTASIRPGASGNLSLPLPSGWQGADALELSGNVLGKWAWMIQSPAAMRARIVDEQSASPASPLDAGASASDAGPSVVRDGGRLAVSAGSARFTFDDATGRLIEVNADGSSFSFGNGPVLAAGSAALESFEAHGEGNDYVITATYGGELREVVWRVLGNGWLSLRYRYAPNGTYAYHGVSFDYPESLVQSVQWLGRGPGRVWNNRLKGTWHDVWASERSGAASGWEQQQFSGYFADVYWARLSTSEGRIDMVLDEPGMYLRLFTVGDAAEASTATGAFPGGDISVLHGIAPIGDGLFAPAALGPQGEPHVLDGSRELEATVYLRFDGRARAAQ